MSGETRYKIHPLDTDIIEVQLVGERGNEWTEVANPDGSVTDCPNEWLFETREAAGQAITSRCTP